MLTTGLSNTVMSWISRSRSASSSTVISCSIQSESGMLRNTFAPATPGFCGGWQPPVLARVVALLHLHLAQKCVQRLTVRAFLRCAHGGLQLRFHGFRSAWMAPLSAAMRSRASASLTSIRDCMTNQANMPVATAATTGSPIHSSTSIGSILTAASQGMLAAESKQTPVNLWEWSR